MPLAGKETIFVYVSFIKHMVSKIFNIKEFASYLNVSKPKNDDLLIVNYENEANIRLQSDSITIDFYLLAIKPPLEKNVAKTILLEDQAKSFMYVDCPQNNLDWDINAPDAGITDIDVLEATDYYKTSRGAQLHGATSALFSHRATAVDWDAFINVETLLTQSLLVVIRDKPGGFGAYRDGQEIYGRAASRKKEILVVEGYSHHDLYDKPEPVRVALNKLIPFSKKIYKREFHVAKQRKQKMQNVVSLSFMVS